MTLGAGEDAYSIRLEDEGDRRAVEELTRRAFWNLNVPGCDEHYLVHRMREHPDFLPELALVLEMGGRIVGNIMYTRAALVDAEGREKQVITFGPLSIDPELQRRGLGSALMRESFARASAQGHDAVVIFGNPGNYVSAGFRSAMRHGVAIAPGVHPAALLVRELIPGAIEPGEWLFRESAAYDIEEEEAAAFDEGFEPRARAVLPRQEEFFILSRARLPG